MTESPAAAATTTPTSAPIASPTPVQAAAAPAPSNMSSNFPDVGAGLPQTTTVNPKAYQSREDYAKALLAEKLGNLKGISPDQTVDEIQSEEKEFQSPSTSDADHVNDLAPGEDAGDSPEGDRPEKPNENSSHELEEEGKGDADYLFELDPDPAITPEGLTHWVKENGEFARLLESDPKLKGQLYKTAREAAELAPYREIFPDIESARSAQADVATFSDVRERFLGSTTREGTLAALAKMAELSYERAEDGSVLTKDGQPVIGEDFFAFVENIASLDLEHRLAEVEDRLKANFYRSQGERERDESVKAALDILREATAAPSPASEEWPERLRLRQEALDRRESELNQRRHGVDVEQRRTFERGLQQEAHKRIRDGIERIIVNVEKQGALISPYLKNILPQAIGARLITRVQANPALQAQMRELQRLPAGEQSRQRRLAAVDRVMQQFLPEVAREELREAGVQIANASAAKRAKVAAQIDTTRKTEPKGSTGPAGGGRNLTASAAFDHAQAEWKAANPGRLFDNAAKEQILPRVLQLMSAR